MSSDKELQTLLIKSLVFPKHQAELLIRNLGEMDEKKKEMLLTILKEEQEGMTNISSDS